MHGIQTKAPQRCAESHGLAVWQQKGQYCLSASQHQCTFYLAYFCHGEAGLIGTKPQVRQMDWCSARPSTLTLLLSGFI